MVKTWLMVINIVKHFLFSSLKDFHLQSNLPVARLKGSEKSAKVSARYPASGGPSKADPPRMKVKTPGDVEKNVKY